MCKAATSIQKNTSLSHCYGDWVLFFDADEVPSDEFVEHIRAILEKEDKEIIAVHFPVLHFYADYRTICVKDPVAGFDWYPGKICAFRNNLGIHHGNADGDPDGLVDNEDKALAKNITHHTPYPIFHYGHVRSCKIYLEKKNRIERRFHLNWKDLESWEFADTNDERYFRRFAGEHPEIMSERIKLSIPLNHEDVVNYYRKFILQVWAG